MERFAPVPGASASRVILGGWQYAGGHGGFDRATAIADLAGFYEAGIDTFDCADIYTGVEELIGDFRAEYARRRGPAALDRLKVFTKCVPDLDGLARLTRAQLRTGVERSLRRLRVERLDLVQYHWWDYEVPGCIEAASWLVELQREGKIDLLGGTNFDTGHVEALIASGMPFRTMQVQYSLLDRRAERRMVAACRRLGVSLLCYGSVAGGFLSERWLGLPEPLPPFEHRSLTKYRLVIDEFGGWALFQELLAVLAAVARRHGVDIATVASRWVLDRPGVGAVIVGVRNRLHLAANLAIGGLRLGAEDRQRIDAVLARGQIPAGDCFGLERDRAGRHGAIMKYNLNKGAA